MQVQRKRLQGSVLQSWKEGDIRRVSRRATYLQGKVAKAEVKVPREEKVSIESRKSEKGAEKSVKGAEKKKSRNVTFSMNLIQ